MELYIHIPFCMKKCEYCDFLSAPYDRNLRAKYTDALCRELRYYGGVIDEPVETVFIGGGTPSWLEPALMEKIIDAMRSSFSIHKNAEVTIEVNPGTVTKDAMASYVSWGINRLSIGLQSANEEELKLLGRIHTYDQFLKTFEIARMQGIDNINVDVMYGLPGQKAETFLKTLRQIVMLKPEHISAYSLMIEEDTPYFERYGEDAKRQAKGEPTVYLPEEDELCAMTESCEKILEEHNFHQYEISNFAKVGYACRHNIGYWRRTPYLGAGLGAASFYNHTRYANERDIYRYIENPIQRFETPLSREDEMAEFMFLGLRTIDGVSRKAFESAFDEPLLDVYGAVLARLIEEGLLEAKAGNVFLTKHGRNVSNAVLAEFLLEQE